MLRLATAAQMRALDKAALDDYGVPGLLLMENAALRVVDVLAQRYAPLRGKRIAIVCGKGNNGGDGLAVARHLHARFGVRIDVLLAASPDEFQGDALANYAMAQKYGVPIKPFAERGDALTRADVVVDALLGTGIQGGVIGDMAQVIETVNAAARPIVAVDVPSGLDADTGRVGGACVCAHVTVTFALAKIGMLDFPGTTYAGDIVVADICLPPALLDASDIHVFATEARDIGGWLPVRTEGNSVNKGIFGAALLLAGSRGLVGASVLCAEAAARTGAGLVTLGVPQDAQNVVMSRISPVVMTRGLPETPQGTFADAALEPALELAAKAQAVGLGPGLGGTSDEGTRAFVRGFAARCPVPLVIDADALNILSADPDHGASILKQRPAATILTPHPGEMGRLLGLDTDAVQADRRAAAAQAAERCGCIALLKGARTLIASPDGRLFMNVTGNAGMATGGAGDTLTGIITALLAGGLDAPEAAACGAYLHGLAGDMVAEAHGGKAGLIATDLIDTLPRAIARCQRDAAGEG